MWSHLHSPEQTEHKKAMTLTGEKPEKNGRDVEENNAGNFGFQPSRKKVTPPSPFGFGYVEPPVGEVPATKAPSPSVGVTSINDAPAVAVWSGFPPLAQTPAPASAKAASPGGFSYGGFSNNANAPAGGGFLFGESSAASGGSAPSPSFSFKIGSSPPPKDNKTPVVSAFSFATPSTLISMSGKPSGENIPNNLHLIPHLLY